MSYIWTLNTTLIRFGISDYAELRLQGDWNNEGGEIFDYNGSENVAIGAKAKLFDGWRFLPAVSMLGNVIIPSKHYDNMPNNWSGQMGLLFQNQLTSWLSLGYEGDLMWFDAEKPIIFYGAGTKAGRITDRVTVDRIAPTIAKTIRIRAPNACSAEPLF